MSWYDDETDSSGTGYMMAFGHCIRCGVTFSFDPDTVPSVSVHAETRCHIRPDGNQVRPGDPDVTREPLCDWCGKFIHRVAAAGTARPLAELFPCARRDLIDLDAARRIQAGAA